MATIAQLTGPAEGISAHAWSPDGDQLALSPNSNELHIYTGCRNPNTATWTREHVLTEHDLLVSSVDWSPVHNKIVTCSHDRNAFVWTYQAATRTWKPALTLLRIDRAALDVKWSPDGKKFAVASGAKVVPVCHYEEEHDWWVSRIIKKHKSTILSVAWHPSSQLLATGACDFKCRVLSAYIEGVDAPQSTEPCGKGLPFGEVYTEFGCNGWVHGVAWSPSGSAVAYAGHDSTIHVVTFPGQGGQATEQVVTLQNLPVSVLSFVSDRAIIAGGHDFNPLVLTAGANGTWSFLQYLDEKSSTGSTPRSSGGGTVQAARALFQSKATRGQESKKEGDELWTKHEAPIISLQPLPTAKSTGGVNAFSTAAMDGRVIQWNLPQLNIAMTSLGLS